MAPLKIEERMKQKLEARTINPSPDGWRSLEARLSQNEPKSTKKPLWWLTLAAAAVALVLLMINLGREDEAPMEIIPVVEVEENEEMDKVKANAADFSEGEQEKVQAELASELTETSDVQDEEKESNRAGKTPNKTPIALNSGETLVLGENEDKKTIPENSSEIIGMSQDILAEVKAEDSPSSAGELDSEVDQLLKMALENIDKSNSVSPRTETVRANALLRGVEDDLDKSFRDRVFKALISGYESVKTAVAERNN